MQRWIRANSTGLQQKLFVRHFATDPKTLRDAVELDYLKQRSKEEAERYAAEKKEYDAKVTKLRKQFIFEHREKEKKKEVDTTPQYIREAMKTKLVTQAMREAGSEVINDGIFQAKDAHLILKHGARSKAARAEQAMKEKATQRDSHLERKREQLRARAEEERLLRIQLEEDAKTWYTEEDLKPENQRAMFERISKRFDILEPITLPFKNTLPMYHGMARRKRLLLDTESLLEELEGLPARGPTEDVNDPHDNEWEAYDSVKIFNTPQEEFQKQEYHGDEEHDKGDVEEDAASKNIDEEYSSSDNEEVDASNNSNHEDTTGVEEDDNEAAGFFKEEDSNDSTTADVDNDDEKSTKKS